RALVRTYLYGIALKMVAGERRKQSRSALPQPDTLRAAPEEAIWVRQALERLDPAGREILMLGEFEQLSYGGISGLTSTPRYPFSARRDRNSPADPLRQLQLLRRAAPGVDRSCDRRDAHRSGYLHAGHRSYPGYRRAGVQHPGLESYLNRSDAGFA